MDIVIIEDESITVEELSDTINEIVPEANIVASLPSIKKSVQYFSNNQAPDLIFCDIHLNDGLCFEIFKQLSISAPIIFCTAYDEYAIQAFKTNGIEYVVKPFSEKAIREAMEKYQSLKQNFSAKVDAISYEALARIIDKESSSKPVTLLVNHKEQIRPIKISQIALFYIENGMTQMLTFEGNHYFTNKILEELEELTGCDFYRISRQHLLNRNAVKSVTTKVTRKLEIELSIPFKQSITVSKAKAPYFLDWLAE